MLVHCPSIEINAATLDASGRVGLEPLLGKRAETHYSIIGRGDCHTTQYRVHSGLRSMLGLRIIMATRACQVVLTQL